MKRESRKVLIERLEIEIDRQINVVVDKFQNLSDDLLNKPGENGGWSIARNLQHLNLYFDYYIPAIQAALEKSNLKPDAKMFKSGWLGNYFTNSMDYRSSKKIKAFKDYIPEEKLDSSKVIRDFIQNEEDFLQLIRKARSYDLTRVRLAISLTKWITMRLGDVFQFVTMHNERHLEQAKTRL